MRILSFLTLFLLVSCSAQVNLQEPKSIAPSSTVSLTNQEVFQLSVDPILHTIKGKQLEMMGYNGQVPGPLIKAKQGETIWVNVTNNLPMETSIHWHGIRLENRFDGVPEVTQDPILPGQSFLYQVYLPDAGMFWYHPHTREDWQQESGLYGNILVEPNTEGYYNKVHREEYLFIDDIFFKDELVFSERISHVLMGRFGNVMLVNGREDYGLTVKKGEVIRFFITNAANTRVFNLSIPGVKLKIVGSDGDLFVNEFFADSVTLAPSERAVVEVQFSDVGVFELAHKHPTRSYSLGQITVLNEKITPDLGASVAQLRKGVLKSTELQPLLMQSPDVTLRLDVSMQGMHMGHMMQMHAPEDIEWEDSMGSMNAMMTDEDVEWQLVDVATGKKNMDINYHWRVGDKIKLRLLNDIKSMHPMQHPIHLHGQRFLVLATDGVQNQHLAWKDTVLVPTGKTVDLLVDVTNPGDWMIHCHIAEHLHSGMMAMFKVS